MFADWGVSSKWATARVEALVGRFQAMSLRLAVSREITGEQRVSGSVDCLPQGSLGVTLVLACFLTTPTVANATQTWCALVDRLVPDGYLVLRAGPSTSYRELARLPAGDYVELSTGECGREVLRGEMWGTTVCSKPAGDWALVEFAMSRHIRPYMLEQHAGWIRVKYLVEHRCFGE